MRLFSRAALDALLPGGSLWSVLPDGGLDRLLDGIAACFESVRQDLKQLAYIRDPQRTPILPDLEKELGVIPRSGATESERRNLLSALKASRNGDGSADFLQRTLRAAGFNVYVHTNNPAVDPGRFVYYAPSSVFGAPTAMFGRSIMAGKRGELLVNGTKGRATSGGTAWLFDSGAGVSFDDGVGITATAGSVPVSGYAVPVDRGFWPLVFFVAGEATRDGSGALTGMADAEVPIERRGELLTLILRCKPLHVWAGLRIQYV